jgi:hypothetical protein
MGGWGLLWGVVGRPGNVLRRSGGPGGCSEAGGGVLMVVDDDTVVVDGSCGAVVRGDMARLLGSLGGAVCVTALAVVVDVVCALESVVTLAVCSVCILASIPAFWSRIRRSSHLSGPCLVSQASRSAFLPCSNAVFRAFSSSSFLSILNALFSLSRPLPLFRDCPS